MPDSKDIQRESVAPTVALESSTYEVIRGRLAASGRELRSRLDQLNEARRNVFGAIETTLLSTERITTAHNCIARDMVAIGPYLLLGYNIHFGLKSETEISDVFSAYRHDAEQKTRTAAVDVLHLLQEASPNSNTIGGSHGFESDFKDLFRYYKNATFAKFDRRGPHLYMVFRVGKTVSEIKVFKWTLQGSGDSTKLRYIDNRSEQEYRFPPQHDFEWIRTTRDDHHYGEHPHISIEDRVFVETVGGDLTIKIENNTESGEGIYAEPVDDPDQTLDDGEIYYATIGNIILLKMRPYQEKEFRYIIYNEKLQTAMRLDSIRDACISLPDDHGLIFSNGYYLQDGEYKTFEHDLADMLFERSIQASNGEDYLYVFYNRDTGTCVLLQYNLIEQRVQTPWICNGWTFFGSGELLLFKAQDRPQKHHAIQVWQTPYVDEDVEPRLQSDSFLHRVGNKDIVRGMAECHEVLNLIDKDDTYANLYSDLVKLTGDISDSYFWLNRDDTFNMAECLAEIGTTAAAAVDEFDKVNRVKKNTADQTKAAESRTTAILAAVRHRRFEHINDFVESLRDLRGIRGTIISLRELRYVDTQLVESLENLVAEQTERLSRRCVDFLLRPASLTPYEKKVRHEQAGIEHLTKVSEARSLEEDIASSAAELEMLIDVVSNLRINDATQRTTIIDNISDLFSTVNQARAILKKKTRELAAVEGIAEFNSQLKLLNQSVVNYLDICDAPQKCEEFLTKIVIQLEELEGQFAEFDEFIVQLTEKREEVCTAFENRKLQLMEARNKRANTLLSAAERVLKGINSRLQNLETVNDINGYFASDLMIEKVRDIVAQLTELDDTVKVDDLQSRLKTIREDAVRQLKDRQDLYVEGENTIRLGTHLFTVNTQALDLTTVIRNDQMCLHLTGTGFFDPVRSVAACGTSIDDFRDIWGQEVVSENASVYRGEYLAWKILQAAKNTRRRQTLAEPRNSETTDNVSARYTLEELATLSKEDLLHYVQQFMGSRYSEAYTKGVHDADAAEITSVMAGMHSNIGLLRHDTRSRVLAIRAWMFHTDDTTTTAYRAKFRGAGAIATAFASDTGRDAYIAELREYLADLSSNGAFLTAETGSKAPGAANQCVHSVENERQIHSAAEYLFEELSGESHFAISMMADRIGREFQQHLKSNGIQTAFDKSVAAVEDDKNACFILLRNWVSAFLASAHSSVERFGHEYADEVAVSLMPGWPGRKNVFDASVDAELNGMIGTHAVIDGGRYHLNYNDFVQKLQLFEQTSVPRFNAYTDLKRRIVEQAREEMRLEEFSPRVLTSFVRNKLLNDVYLPLIGDNLAKQIGAAGETKRTDLMGLLLLVSPPGYGKTTLMEYIANRLGLIFMKINGPALGHAITSLDPSEASNAGAREEVEKLNLALEMGDNVMIYLDDIQHTHPEFLQKFISLCDAQRRIEGVYKGKTRTYDLRGRKVAVVMAGNPYTESGEKFQIPDMLSNRADIYNLGEIIGNSRDAFEMSYLENALTSNPILAKLASRSQQDVYAVIRMASSEPRDGIELEGNYSLEEIDELVNTMQKLMRVRDVILAVNREYIRSAAQSDEYRTEPAFKLQGSYRNMNRIAEKVVPIMNESELTTLIVSNYENDAQTLTSGAEANLLKFKELIGLLTEEEAGRWEDIKRTFRQNIKLRGVDDNDRTGQIIVTLGSLGDGLDDIRKALTDGISQIAATDRRPSDTAEQNFSPSNSDGLAARITEQLTGLQSGLAAINSSVADGLQQLAARSAEFAYAQMPETSGEKPSAKRQEFNSGRITVVNKIPPTVVAVLRQQFKVMKAWMQPIHETTQAQRIENRELLNRLEECTQLYTQLIERIEKGIN